MATFQGQYVEELKLAAIASAVSGVHVMFIGKPGRGKTMIAKFAAMIMFGVDRVVFLRFDATTPPEKIQGHPDIAKLLSETPVFELVKDGSIYDPNAKCIILDELFRAMDTSYDIVLDALDRQDINADDAPVAFATSNFTATSERTEALRDRIGLWVWLPDEALDVKAIVMNQLQSLGVGLELTDHIPTYADIQRVRAARPGKDAIQCIAETIETLAAEAEKGLTDDNNNVVARFEVNPRRLDQWGRILFRMGYWLTGDDNFSVVPDQAKKCLRWAWPLTDERQAQHWAAVVGAIADPVDGAIQALMNECYKKFRDVSDRKLSPSAAAVEFGKVMTEGMQNITSLGIEDARIDQAINDLTNVYGKFVRGENPFE